MGTNIDPPKPDSMERLRDLGTRSFKWIPPSISSPHCSGKPTKQEVETVRSRVMDDSKVFVVATGTKHIWAHRHYVSIHRFFMALCQMGLLELKGEVDLCSHP